MQGVVTTRCHRAKDKLVVVIKEREHVGLPYTARTIFALLALIAGGCKIDVVAPEGATIRSESGVYECIGPNVCTIEVNDVFFNETFRVETEGDLIFAGWKRRDRGLCGGLTDACPIVTSLFAGNEVLEAFLASDETFFLEADIATEVAMLSVAKDTTIFADRTADSISDGKIFVGRNNNGSIRRGLIAFDLSAIPAGAAVKSAELTLNVSNARQSGVAIRAHRLNANWGEGATSGVGRGEGQSSPAMMGEATWEARFFNMMPWNNAGGDFRTAASATATTDDSISWGSAGLMADVQFWVDNPNRNFGWILIGDERTPQSVQGFHSKESPMSVVPRLTVTYSETSNE